VIILRKYPWGAMTTYKGINNSMNFWETPLGHSAGLFFYLLFSEKGYDGGYR